MGKKSRIYVIKLDRKKLILLGTIIVLIGIIAFLKSSRVSKIFNPKDRQIIVIDPGHGGIDGGTGDRNDILEKDINLDVGLKLKKELLVEGFEVIMTREKDVSLEELSSIKASRYRRDLDARKSIINENDPLVFVSIHVNSSKKSSARGIKIYHFPNSMEGQRLAESIAKSVDIHVYDKFLKDTSLRAEVLSENFYVLRETKYTGVLVEVGFITNLEENKLLKDRKYKEKVAFAIKKGILEYLSSD
ncbi:cell wall hydrolase [Clostridium sp. Cult3]|nr:cell wall hydrolase [Clostridium sp. Cult3]